MPAPARARRDRASVAWSSMAEPAELLSRAALGEAAAWDEIVERYARLVWSVVRGFRLDAAAAQDVTQTVWLRLVEHIGRIEHPDRLVGWLATTARNEAMRVSRLQRRHIPFDVDIDPPDRSIPPPDERLLDDELSAAVAEAFGRLDEGCRELLVLLCADPPLDYATVARILDRPVGSLGPTRGRCLDRLRALMAVGEGGRS